MGVLAPQGIAAVRSGTGVEEVRVWRRALADSEIERPRRRGGPRRGTRPRHIRPRAGRPPVLAARAATTPARAMPCRSTTTALFICISCSTAATIAASGGLGAHQWGHVSSRDLVHWTRPSGSASHRLRGRSLDLHRVGVLPRRPLLRLLRGAPAGPLGAPRHGREPGWYPVREGAAHALRRACLALEARPEPRPVRFRGRRQVPHARHGGTREPRRRDARRRARATRIRGPEELDAAGGAVLRPGISGPSARVLGRVRVARMALPAVRAGRRDALPHLADPARPLVEAGGRYPGRTPGPRHEGSRVHRRPPPRSGLHPRWRMGRRRRLPRTSPVPRWHARDGVPG